MSAIHVKNLTKRWNETTAVDDISFTVPSGSLTVLLGPSGCGKSTTLRLIAGLEEASDGSVSINDEDVTGLPASKRNISMVFQSYALFPHLSVAENILFGLKVRGTPRAERQARLDKTAALLGLSDLLDRKPAEISGGQQQRVALGRAIISERGICLMDEPLSNLDAKLRHEMRVELRALQQKLGMTMVYVTHDQAEAISMADQIVLMNKGKIEQNAAPRDLYGTPASLFSARFIGTPPMNIVEARPIGDKHLTLGGKIVADDDDGTPVLLGLRPEDIRLDNGGDCEATVMAGEYLGADTLLDCKVGDQVLTVRATGTNGLHAGVTVRLDWPADAQHFFDKDTGRRRDTLAGEAERSAPAAPARYTPPYGA